MTFDVDRFHGALRDALAATEHTHGCRVAMAVHDPVVPALEFSWRGEESFAAASTMKVPVMIEVMRRIDRGEMALGDVVALDPHFRSIADNSPFTVDAEAPLRPRVGQTATLLELLEHMIVFSDNLATNLLLARTGTAAVTATIHSLGVADCTVLRLLYDDPARLAGIDNRVTARGLNRLMEAIVADHAASAAACMTMRRILKAQYYREMIPAGVPAGVVVGNKTGWEDDIAHDTAFVCADAGPYYATILADSLPSTVKGAIFAPGLSRMVYEARAAALNPP